MKKTGNLRGWRQQGVALIAVLWIVAALAIVVAGISYSVRSELRQVAVSRDMVRAKARAEAAMVLVLQQMSSSDKRPNRVVNTNVAYEGQTIDVEIMPLNGLIDINNAPAPLLVRLFENGANIAPQAAEELAKSVVAARVKPDKQGRAVRFDAIQDLLRVQGVDYELYARLAPLLTAEAGGSGRVNPLAAPERVLRVILGGGAAASLANFVARRQADEVGLDITMFDGSFVDTASTQRFRLKARVPLLSGSHSLMTCDVEFSARTQGAMPWSILHCVNQFETNPGKRL